MTSKKPNSIDSAPVLEMHTSRRADPQIQEDLVTLATEEENSTPGEQANVAETDDHSEPQPLDASELAEIDAYSVEHTLRTFGRYQLLMKMAQGGMATLFLAQLKGPEQFEKLLVIKKIHSHLAQERNFIDMFLDEARIAALIHHPNVVSVFEMGEENGAYYIAMDYVHGQNLTEVLRAALRQEYDLPWTHGVRVVADVAAGLHAAHELTSPDGESLGVVHRDVSPQNIMISYDGHTQITDFGIAYAAEKVGHTAEGTLKGKLAYMSPEHAGAKKLDRRADIFSLGVVLWEAVCMQRLFREANEAATLRRVLAADVPSPSLVRPEIPIELEQIILKALALDPDDRFATAGDMADELERLLMSSGEVVGPRQLTLVMKKFFRDRRRIKDEQIKAAMAVQSDAPVKGFGMESSNSGLSIVGQSRQRGQSKVRRNWVYGASALLVSAAVVLLLLYPPWSTRSKDRDGPRKPTAAPMTEAVVRPPPPMRRARPVAPPMVATVTLIVVITPQTAKPQITFRGKQHAGSIFKVVVPRSNRLDTLEVRAKGYRSAKVRVSAAKDQTLHVQLKRRRGRRRRSSSMRRGQAGMRLLGLPR